MKKIVEGIEVNVKETQDNIEKTVKDLVFGVNTMTSGKVTFITEPINGILEGIFVDSQEPIQLRVTIGDSDIEVFNIQSIQGEQFVPIRLGVVDSLGVAFGNIADKWALNDVLRFEVKGPMNSQVKLIVRYR